MRVRTLLLLAMLAVCPAVPAQEDDYRPQDMGVERAKVDDLDVLAEVHFHVGSAELTPQARLVLDEAVARLAAGPADRLEVGGHTDSSGAEALNHELSHQRATAVLAYLVARGVPRERLEAIGYAANQPVDDNATAAGRSRNRRVHLKAWP